ncbi:MAG TPA: hypothetical protein VGF25_12035 [Thermoleophilaceae bacterium]
MQDSLTLPAHFSGPPGSANGGYTCGRVAGLLGAEVAEVSLRSPPPLERALTVARADGGVVVSDGETLVAEARPAELLMDVPDALSVAEAREASRAGERHWCEFHPFPGCVVCGPERDAGDGYRMFPGEVEDGLFASVWEPNPSLAGDDGCVAPECVWAALDCPTSAPVANFATGPPIVLARLTARLGCPVHAGEEHVVLSWPVEVDGRKRHGAAALYDSQGRLLAASRALWIELRA